MGKKNLDRGIIFPTKFVITLLTVTPIWLIFAVLFFLCIAIHPLGRKYFEGTAYNISISSEYGDAALIAVVLITAGIIQRQGAPIFLEHYQLAIVLVSIVIGILDHTVAAGWPKKPQTKMDTYHNLVVVPLLVYLVLFTGLWVNLANGTALERVATITLGVIYLVTFLIDLKTGRIEQSKYLREHSGTPTIV